MEMPLRIGMPAEATEIPPFVSRQMTRTRILSHTERNNCWVLEGNSVEPQILQATNLLFMQKKNTMVASPTYINIELLGLFFSNN